MRQRHFVRFILSGTLALCFFSVPDEQVCFGQSRPINEGNLLSSLGLGKAQQKGAQIFIDLIKKYGVDFPMTGDDESKIRLAGAYLGDSGLNNLIRAIRDNYRPIVSRPQVNVQLNIDPSVLVAYLKANGNVLGFENGHKPTDDDVFSFLDAIASDADKLASVWEDVVNEIVKGELYGDSKTQESIRLKYSLLPAGQAVYFGRLSSFYELLPKIQGKDLPSEWSNQITFY